MNNLKKLIVLVTILLAQMCFADQGAVTFTQLNQNDTNITSSTLIYNDTNDTIFLANGTNGIMVLDTNLNQTISQIVDNGVDISNIAVKDGYAYAVSTDNILYAYEINDSNLTLKSSLDLDLSEDINDSKVISHYLYLANGVNGIQIVDIADPTNMSIMGTLSTTDAQDMIIKDDILYLADGWGGLRTINVSNPDDPDIVDTQDGTFVKVAIDNNKLFALSSDKITYFDISNPIVPLLVKELATQATPVGDMYAYDSNVYVVENGNIRAYSSVDNTLVVSSNYTDMNNVNSFVIKDQTAYIVNDSFVRSVFFKSDLPNSYADANVSSVNAVFIPYTTSSSASIRRSGLFPADANDTDVLKIEAQAGVLTFDVYSDTDINCTVYDDNNNIIKNIASSGGNSNLLGISFNSVAENYYIMVQPVTPNTQDVEYTIDISLYTDKEPNSINVASIINLGEDISGDIINDSDKDVFKVFISGKGKLKVSSEASLLNIKLYENTIDTTIASSGNLQDDNLEFNIPRAGYYFVELTSNQTNYQYKFNLSFQKDAVSIYRDDAAPSLKVLQSFEHLVDIVLFNATNSFGTFDNKFIEGDTGVNLSTILSTDFAKSVKDLKIVGEYAYIVTNANEIYKYKIKTNELKFISSITLPDSLSKIIIDGSYGYTFSGSQLYIIDISTNTLTLSKTVSIGQNIVDMALDYAVWNKQNSIAKTRNGYIYLALEGDSELRVYSIEDDKMFDDSQTGGSSFKTFNSENSHISKILIANKRLYALRDNKLKIYDISVPVYASLLGEVDVGDTYGATDIQLDSNHIYIAPGLKVVDISDETTPKLVAYDSNSNNTRLGIRDNIAYITSPYIVAQELAYDYGDSTETAKDLAPTATIHGNISNIVDLYSSQDVDCFKITVTTSGVLDVNLTSVNNNLQFTSDRLTNSTHVYPGVYYIKIKGIHPTDDGGYTLTTKLTADDHSDVASDATDITLNQLSQNNNLFDTGYDSDWFKFTVDSRGNIDISTFTESNSSTKTKIELYYDDQTTLITKDGFNTDSNNPNSKYNYNVNTTLNPGTYYIKIIGDDTASLDERKGNYDIKVSYTPTDDFTLEGGFDGITSYNISQIAYGNKNIFTFTNDNKIVSYNHLLKKLGSRNLGDDVNNICKQPFIHNEYIYINMTYDQNSSKCEGYKKLSIDINGDQGDNSDNDLYVSNYEYNYYKDLYLNYIESKYTGDYIKSAAVYDNYLVIAHEDNILTYDISDQVHPVLKGFYGQYYLDKYIEYDNFKYTMSHGMGLAIYDNNDTLQSRVVKENVQDISIVNNTVYMLSDNEIDMIDVTDKTNPVIKQTARFDDSNARKIVANGNYVYILGWNNMDIVDKTSLKIVGTYQTQSGDLQNIDIDGNYAYLVGYNGMEIVDITSKTSPSLYMNYPVLTDIEHIAHNSDNIYIFNNSYSRIEALDKDILINQYLNNKIESDLTEEYSDIVDAYVKDTNISDRILGTFGGDNTEDWYKISSDKYTDMILKSNDIASFTVFNENNEYITSSNDNGDIAGVILDPGTYYIRINCWKSTEYTLDFRESADSILVSSAWYATEFQANDTNITTRNGTEVTVYDVNGTRLSPNPYYNIPEGNVHLGIRSISIQDNNLYTEDLDGYYRKYSINSDLSFTDLGSSYDYNSYFSNINLTSKQVGLTQYIIEDNKLVKQDISDQANPKFLEQIDNVSGNRFITDLSNNYAYMFNDGEMAIIALNDLHYEQHYDNFSNITILDANDKYRYEYGDMYNSSYVIRVDNGKNIDNQDAVALYSINNVSSLVSKDSTAIIASGKALEFVDFSNDKMGVLKSTKYFDDDIEFMKIHPSMNIVYVKLIGVNSIKIFNFDDLSNIHEISSPLFNADIMPDINSIHIVDNKFFVASKDFGIQGATIQSDGSLQKCRNLDNIGINVQHVFSMDGSTVNYTSSATKEDIGKGNDNLNVFFLRDTNILDGNSDSIYSVSNGAPKEGCFIATAGYGSYFEPHVKVLREFRDKVLLKFALGKQFVHLYYKYSPAIATNIAQSEVKKSIVRFALTPIVYMIKYPFYALLLLLLLGLIRFTLIKEQYKYKQG